MAFAKLYSNLSPIYYVMIYQADNPLITFYGPALIKQKTLPFWKGLFKMKGFTFQFDILQAFDIR